MGKIYCVMGKSSSGKDTIYRQIMERNELPLHCIIPYTTRPIRDGETDGKEYNFCDEAKMQELENTGSVVEYREYNTVYGVWKYFTVDDGKIDLATRSYLYIVTLDGYFKMQKYFGKEHVVPIYIEVEDGERLLRAIERERQGTPRYKEMCRRFLADSVDFSDKNLADAGIDRRFVNNRLEDTIREITDYIQERMKE